MSTPVVDIFPPSIQGAGKTKVQWVPTLADPPAPALAEVTGDDTFDMTCYFLNDAFQINHEQATEDDTRLCDEVAREQLGRSTFSIDNLSYVYDPQDTEADTPGNLAATRLLPGTSGFLVVRLGLSAKTAFSASDLVDVYAANLGTQHHPIPTGDNSKFVVEQPITLSRVATSVALAAA